MRRRLTYANVTATVALFLALGGASYAAFELPRNSVGPRQLKPGAVGQRALGVALGGAAVERQDVQTFHDPTVACRHTSPPPPCAAPPPQQLATLTVRARAPGLLLVTATANVADASGPQGDEADVTLTAQVDRVQTPGQSSTRIADRASATVPFQSSARIGKGLHTVTLQIEATNYDGELRVSPLSLHAVVVPPAAK